MLDCAEKNKRGEPCAGRAIRVEADGVPRCFAHATDPDRLARRSQRTGRPKTIAPPRPRNANEVADYLGWVIREVAMGRLDEKRAAVIEKMCAGLIAAREAGELNDRLARLEAAVKERPRE